MPVELAEMGNGPGGPGGRAAPFDPEDRIRRIESRRIVHGIEALVLASLPERLSETFLSQMAGASLLRINRAFLDIRGAALHAALRRLRVEELRRRLEMNAALSIQAAAQQCGFGYFAHAQQAFLRRFGVRLDEFHEKLRRSPKTPRLRERMAAAAVLKAGAASQASASG